MGHVRVLHCGKSIKNYYLCIESRIVGFTQRFSSGGTGDQIYIAVNVNGKSLCGVRALLGEITDQKPEWEDSERYIRCYKIKNLEFCELFDLSILRKVDKRWGAKFILSSKSINVQKAISTLEKKFNSSKCDTLDLSLITCINTVPVEDGIDEDNKTINDEKIQLLGTFETVRFKNETDPNKGLEGLVNQNFYDLFESITEDKNILIPKNRLFITKGVRDSNHKIIPGTKSIPDALLITLDQDNVKLPIRINLIEYECYGENKTGEAQKKAYLGQVILKQLMKFASTFSVTTDYQLRQTTIENWISKIMNYINSNETLNNKINTWVKTLNPLIKESGIDRYFEQELKKAFRFNLQIILIIDEMTVEDKKFIERVINSYPLEQPVWTIKPNSIQFKCYVVKLQQVFKVFNPSENYALTLQEF